MINHSVFDQFGNKNSYYNAQNMVIFLACITCILLDHTKVYQGGSGRRRRWGRRRAGTEDCRDDGEEKSCRLPRASLCTCHEVSPFHHDWYGMFLNWCRLGVLSQLRVSEDNFLTIQCVVLILCRTPLTLYRPNTQLCVISNIRTYDQRRIYASSVLTSVLREIYTRSTSTEGLTALFSTRCT